MIFLIVFIFVTLPLLPKNSTCLFYVRLDKKFPQVRHIILGDAVCVQFLLSTVLIVICTETSRA